MRCSFPVAVGQGLGDPCPDAPSCAWVYRVGTVFPYCPRHARMAATGVFEESGYVLLSMDELAAWEVLGS